MSSLNAVTGSTLTRLQNYLDKYSESYQNTIEQLSSGEKYNSASDNPVAVSKSVKLAVSINTNERAESNASIGQDVLSLAADTESNVIDNISRISDLCLQLSNGTNSSDDESAIFAEIQSRLSYIDTASTTTTFNGISLLDGSSSDLTLQVGADADDRINVGDSLLDVNTTTLGINVTTVDDLMDNMSDYMTKLDSASASLVSSSSKIGAYQNRLTSITDSLTSVNTNLTQKKSDIMDVDVASASSDLVRYQILEQASVNILAQANQISSLALDLLNK